MDGSCVFIPVKPKRTKSMGEDFVIKIKCTVCGGEKFIKGYSGIGGSSGESGSDGNGYTKSFFSFTNYQCVGCGYEMRVDVKTICCPANKRTGNTGPTG